MLDIAIRGLLIAAAVIAAASVIALDRMMITYRDSTHFRIIQPLTMHFVHVGGLLGCVRVILMSFGSLKEHSGIGIDSVHFISYWIGHLAFWLIQGTLMIKAWRTQLICRAGLRRMKVSNARVASIIFRIIFVVILYLTIFTGVLAGGKCINTTNELNKVGWCYSAYRGFTWPLVGLESLCVLTTLLFAWKAKSAPEGLQDTHQIVNSTLGTMCIALICVPYWLVTMDETEVNTPIIELSILAAILQVALHLTGTQALKMAIKQKWFVQTVKSHRQQGGHSSGHEPNSGPSGDVEPSGLSQSGGSYAAGGSSSKVPNGTPTAPRNEAQVRSVSPVTSPIKINPNPQENQKQHLNPQLLQNPKHNQAHQHHRTAAQLRGADLRHVEAWWAAPEVDRILKQLAASSQGNYRNIDHKRPLFSTILGATRGDRELCLLVDTIQVACKAISRNVTDCGSCTRGREKDEAALTREVLGARSASGRQQKQLDIIANQILAKALFHSKCCCVLVSSEKSEPLIIPQRRAGSFCVAYHPLNGSTNVDCNVSVGTIFAIWRKTSVGSATVADILRPGRELVCAGYCVYSFSTELVLTFGSGIKRFTLDSETKEFFLADNCVSVPSKPKHYYSINETYTSCTDSILQAYIQALKNDRLEPYSLRYVGSMIADVHRTISYGGVYMYPSDRRRPQGKLHILYECAPMAFIMEQAGGEATTGMYRGEIGRVLDVDPKTIHDTCPFIVGSARDIGKLRDFYNNGIMGWSMATGALNNGGGARAHQAFRFRLSSISTWKVSFFSDLIPRPGHSSRGDKSGKGTKAPEKNDMLRMLTAGGQSGNIINGARTSGPGAGIVGAGVVGNITRAGSAGGAVSFDPSPTRMMGVTSRVYPAGVPDMNQNNARDPLSSQRQIIPTANTSEFGKNPGGALSVVVRAPAKSVLDGEDEKIDNDSPDSIVQEV